MDTEDTVLEGCEIICIGKSIPPTDLIACPLSVQDIELCTARQQYQAGCEEGRREDKDCKTCKWTSACNLVGNFLNGGKKQYCSEYKGER